jgi:hypothetical protein
MLFDSVPDQNLVTNVHFNSGIRNRSRNGVIFCKIESYLFKGKTVFNIS